MKKEKRILQLAVLKKRCKNLQDQYKILSPAWALLETFNGTLTVLHHLESETNFDDYILGAKNES